MNPKTAAVLVIAFTLTFPLQTVDFASANYSPPPSIEIYQPYSGAVYSSTSLTLNVRVNVLPHEWVSSISYSIDDGKQVKLANITREENLWYWTETKGVLAHGQGFSATATIDNLSEGNHKLTVYSKANGEEMSRQSPLQLTTITCLPRTPTLYPTAPRTAQYLPNLHQITRMSSSLP